MSKQQLCEKIKEAIDRIVNEVHPLRIVLFGSAARDNMRVGSDIDLLVVMPPGTHKRKIEQILSEKMLGLGVPVDIVVATQADLEIHRDTIGLIYQDVLREGKELYAA